MDCDLPITVRSIQRILLDLKFKRSKIKKIPEMTRRHEELRIEFAENYVDLGSKWKIVIFTDEKKFKLSGPDGYAYYLHDISKNEPELLSPTKRQEKGFMVWAGFSSLGQIELIILDRLINAETYSNYFNNVILPAIHQKHGETFIFQQDNAPIHFANTTQNWMDLQNIERIKWPSNSPDLNPMENIWGIISHKVYHGGTKYKDKDTLWDVIQDAWNNIAPETFHNLAKSMKKRCTKVLKRNGKYINY